MRPRLLHIDECEAVGAYKKYTYKVDAMRA